MTRPTLKDRFSVKLPKFKDSDVTDDLEVACANLQGILEGYTLGNNRAKIWGNWKARLQEAYDLAQTVLDEMQVEFEQDKP